MTDKKRNRTGGKNMKKITAAEVEELTRPWDAMADRQRITLLRREAERLRALKTKPSKLVFMTAEEWADAFDELADRIAAGEAEEEENPEQLAAEAEVSRQMADLLKRQDAGSLNTVLKRWGVEPSH
jgi:hypothetical protein